MGIRFPEPTSGKLIRTPKLDRLKARPTKLASCSWWDRRFRLSFQIRESSAG
jgi:hypothetical protein